MIIKTLCSALLITNTCYVFSYERMFVFGGKTYTYDQAMQLKNPPRGVDVVVGVDKGCSERVEKILGVGYRVFEFINLVEGGKNGIAVHGLSDKGHKSWDVGLYQINEVNWSKYANMPGMTPFHLRWNDCSNMIAAAYRLEPFYKKAMAGYKLDKKNGLSNEEANDRVFYQLAGYHTQTEAIRLRYKKRLDEHLIPFLLGGKIVSLWGN